MLFVANVFLLRESCVDSGNDVPLWIKSVTYLSLIQSGLIFFMYLGVVHNFHFFHNGSKHTLFFITNLHFIKHTFFGYPLFIFAVEITRVS